MRLSALALFFAALAASQSRPVPPPGIAVPPADRAELEAGVKALGDAISPLKSNPLYADVAIYHNAVRYALEYNEIFKPEEIGKARELLRQGQARAADLAQGRHPWTTAPGLVVRGYVSKIDKSIQPYGLVIPPSYSPTAPHRWRLDAWFHGRNETLSEVNFLSERQRSAGEFTPADTIVLHLYGRYCNANRFAGEVDLFEALADVKRNYPIDENRILVRGFSMGGAAVWHIAAHYSGLWAAAAPGAGFSETLEFLRIKPEDVAKMEPWHKQLLHLYDSTDHAINFFNLPLVAYNGDIDGQKQAADAMERALAAEGLRLRRVIGPNTGHKYHPDSKVEINQIVDAIAERGRDPYPRQIRFTTYSLAYNRMKWVVVDSLIHHWTKARIDADITGPALIEVRTSNIAAFSFEMGAGGYSLDPAAKPTVVIDGQKVIASAPMTDRSWTVHFRKMGTQWVINDNAQLPGLHKRHGLQGPIDDAFLDSFLFVTPTGTAASPAVAKWVGSEQPRAIAAWRKQFRGEAQVRKDTEITDADIAANNLVLWGDPASNRILARIAGKLPMKWPSDPNQALILIYPNPLNPNRYVVLNSGFTFREFDYLNNARQYPHLPDYAVIDLATPPDDRYPGKILNAGFFNEDWQ